jgi:hypothetical protein
VSAPNYTSPNNAFSCLGLYVGPSTSEVGEHNEITMCISANATRSIRCAYWIGYDGGKVGETVVESHVRVFGTLSLCQ